MEASIMAGNPENGYWVRFTRTSSDNFAFIQLDYGDGSPLWEGTQFDTIVHHYSTGGIYKTNLSGWINNNCVSSVTELVFTDAFTMNVQNMPGGTDYVMPGDANGDREANVYDLLNIGIGHYVAGVPRPNATTAWTPQFAPDWPNTVADAVNYKHLDCDGNGTVNALDADVIVQHYAPIDTTPVFNNAAAPPIWVSFPMDTIYMDTDNPQPLEISADLMLGTAAQPAIGLYGLAFALRYPEFVSHNLSANYALASAGHPQPPAIGYWPDAYQRTGCKRLWPFRTTVFPLRFYHYYRRSRPYRPECHSFPDIHQWFNGDRRAGE